MLAVAELAPHVGLRSACQAFALNRSTSCSLSPAACRGVVTAVAQYQRRFEREARRVSFGGEEIAPTDLTARYSWPAYPPQPAVAIGSWRS